MKDKKESGSGKGLAVGVGLATLAAAAGAYFLYGTKDGAKKRKQMKGWMLKAKGEVVERMENLKELNEEVYQKVVDEVAEQYKKLPQVDPEELSALADDLRSHWKNIKKDLMGGAKPKSKSKK